MAAAKGDVFYLDAFAARQWDDPKYSGTRISYDKEEFVRRVHEYHKEGAGLVDGYAPFCKHVFVPNFVGAKAGNVKITDDIRKSIETAYESRSPEELAVLSRCARKRLQPVMCCACACVLTCMCACALRARYSRKQLLRAQQLGPDCDAQVEGASSHFVSLRLYLDAHLMRV